MSDLTLASVSDQLADAVERIGASVVQVQGHRRPASGIVYAADAVVTTARAIGREERPHVRTPDGRQLQADIAGWDPATHLAVLRVPELAVRPADVSDTPPRAGHLALAVGRSWSNGLTASLGVVSIIGGPLPTGRGLAIPEIIRTSAQMHGGFAGGAFTDGSGRLIGICTAAEIRGLAVVIPIGIAWRAAGDLLQHGRRQRGHLGVAGQPVRLAPKQSGPDGPDRGVVVVAVAAGSPADAAGLLVGDVLVELDGHAIQSPEELLQLLGQDRVGRAVTVRVIRGTTTQELTVTIGERP